MKTIRGTLLLALLVAAGCSGTDGPDPGALDGSSTDPDGAIQQCTGGQCCDTTSGTFKPATAECGSKPVELRCQSPQSCGSVRQRRQVKQYCSGSSAACDGAVKRGAWEPTAACGATQKCSGPGTCASDTACGATGCTAGVCCDTSTKNFKPATVQCATTKEYKCVSSGCGAQRQWRDAIRHCSGNSAGCDGKTTYGSFAATGGCGPTEACTGSGVCTASSTCTTTKPTVSASPTAGPRGTVFSEPGSGFTQNGQAKLYFKYPDGKMTTATKVADAKGNYTHSWTTSAATPTGKYEHWAVDGASGVKSNTVQIEVTISPKVTVTPSKGPRGTVFSEPGEGFTPGGNVTLSFQYPSGKVTSTSKTADAAGSYTHSWTSGATTATGTYTYWAVDTTTGVKSNTVLFDVTM